MTAAETAPSPPPTKPLWTLLSVVVLDLVGFGIVIPILPYYVRHFGASAWELGLLVTSFAAVQFFLAPFWGRLSDRFGRRPVILLTIAGTSLALLVFGLGRSLAWLFAGRILGGAFGANISVATAYIADLTRAEERTRWMGMIGAAFGVGFILGPALGGLLAPFGYHVPLLFAAGLAAANFVYAAFALREPERQEAEAEPPSPAALARAAARSRLVRRMCLLYFLFTFAVSQLETMFAFFMLDRFGYDAHQVAWLLVVMAVVMAGIQGGAIRSLSRRFGERRLLLAGTLLLGASCGVLPWMPSVGLLLLPLVVSSVGRGIAHPAMLGLVSGAAGAESRGGVLGAFQASASLARVAAPLAAGALYELRLWSPFVAAGVILLLVFGLAAGLEPQAAAAEAPAAGEPAAG